LAAFVGVAALLTIIPGADTLLVVRNSLARGRAGGLLTTLGICSGLFVHAMLSAVGVSAVGAHSAPGFQVLESLGSGVLFVLGAHSLYGALIPQRQADTPARAPAARGYVEGLLTNVLNPKVAIFYLAVLPQFVSAADPVLARSLLLAGIHAGLGLAWLSLIAILTGRTRSILTSAGARRMLQGVAGAARVGVGARLPPPVRRPPSLLPPALVCRLVAPDRHVELLLAPPAEHGDPHLLADRRGGDHALEITRAIERRAVERDDHVVRFDAALIGGLSRHHGANQNALRLAQLE